MPPMRLWKIRFRTDAVVGDGDHIGPAKELIDKLNGRAVLARPFVLMLHLFPAVENDAGGGSDEGRDSGEESGHKIASCLFLGFY